MGDENGCTALHWASSRGVMGIIVRLIEKSSDVNASNAKGIRPLHKACMCGFDSVVKKLVEYGADLDAPDAEGNTPLHYCARSGFTLVVKALLSSNANTTLKNKAKETALDVACDKLTKDCFEGK